MKLLRRNNSVSQKETEMVFFVSINTKCLEKVHYNIFSYTVSVWKESYLRRCKLNFSFRKAISTH